MQERLHLEKLKADWEAYRLTSEAVWRESLRDKERDMRTRLEADVAKSIAERADMSRSAAMAGLEYPALIERILALGLAYRSEWRILYG